MKNMYMIGALYCTPSMVTLALSSWRNIVENTRDVGDQSVGGHVVVRPNSHWSKIAELCELAVALHG